MIYNKLYEWQKQLVDNISSKQAYGLFLDMGLGKTPISLALAEKHNSDKVLIISLNNKALENQNVSGSWLNWASQMEKQYKLSNKKENDFTSDLQAYLINYEFMEDRKQSNIKGICLRKEVNEFIQSCKGKRVSIILDESHKIKSSKSNQSKCVNKIYTQLKSIADTKLYLLTGTPFTNGYIDLYTQLKLLGCEYTKEQFKNEFCVIGHIRGLYEWQQPIVAYKNVDKLFDLVHKYAITINSKDVVDLPKQIFVNHTYNQTKIMNLFMFERNNTKYINEELKKRNLELLQDKTSKVNNPFFRNIAYPNFTWSAETASEFWLRARELSIGFQGNADSYLWYDDTRLNLLKEFLKENPSNYLLFYSFTPELVNIYDICNELGYKIDIYCGDIKSTEYYNEYVKMNSDEKFNAEKRILICNWQSGSTGMNFQAYNKCIMFDLPVFRDYQQGIKRIHRIGQNNNCIYHIFNQDNFLDNGMLEAIKEQKDYTKDTFNSDLERVNKLLNTEE